MTASHEQLALIPLPGAARRGASLRLPAELRADAMDTQTISSIRLPEGRSVPFTRRVQSILDHPAMQRLRRVRQLGPMHLVYPGATHTRFEHSLGVYACALECLRSLLHHDAFAASVSERELLAMLAAALLQDVGHVPFSHNVEALHPEQRDVLHHDRIGARIIRGEVASLRGERALTTILSDEWGVDPERVIALCTGEWPWIPSPTERALRSLLSGVLSVNKMDYLERDSHHMGLPYGRGYDRQRLIASLTLHPDGERVAVLDKGRLSAEAFLFARHAMYSEAYWHHTVRAANAMVEAALDAFRSCTQFSDEALLEVFLRHDDDRLLDWLRDQTADRSATHYLINGMSGYRRALYKRVLTLTRRAEDWRHDAFERLADMTLEERYGLVDRLRVVLSSRLGYPLHPADLIIDVPMLPGLTSLRPTRLDVVYRDGTRTRAWPLTELSSIAQGLDRDFAAVIQKIRLFAEPRLAARLEEHPNVQDIIVAEIMR